MSVGYSFVLKFYRVNSFYIKRVVKDMHLKISNSRKFRLEFDSNDIHRFSQCKFWYNDNEVEIELSEDYLYIFVEEILGRIDNIPSLKHPCLFGKVGAWQEYYYFDPEMANNHIEEIAQMESAMLVSTECFGTFLYEYRCAVWLEIDKGFDKIQDRNTREYYNNPDNYRVILTSVSKQILCEWKTQLTDIKKKYSAEA